MHRYVHRGAGQEKDMARKKKIAELEEILERIPEDKKYIGRKIVEELIFMQDTLTVLKRKIRENGTEEEFVQGKQNFVRESTALKSYNTTIQRYSTLYRQLSDLMPKNQGTGEGNAVYDFLKGGGE